MTASNGTMTPQRRRRWPWIIGGSLTALVIIGSCNANSGTPTAYAPTPSPTTNSVPAPVTAPAGPVTNIGDGVFEVGTGSGQVPPGTYRTAGPIDSLGCYWDREKDTSGSLDALIANDIVKGPTVVTIKATDGAFKSSGCQPWSK